jgi:hypothetical protein
MARRFLLNERPNMRVWFEPQEDGTFLIRHEGDVEPELDANKAMASHNDGYNADRSMRRAAHIPDIIAVKWLTEEGWWLHDPEAAPKLKQKLNDPEWRHLRTAHFTV